MASETPVIPNLNIEKVKDAAVDKKRSFGAKLGSSLKRMMTPRGSANNLPAAAERTVEQKIEAAAPIPAAAPLAAAPPAPATPAPTVAETVEKVATDVKTETARLGQEAKSVVDKAGAKDDKLKFAVGTVLAAVAVVAGVLAASNKKKEEVPVAPPKKKWF